MEALHLPVRELRQRYTKSEMAIMAWRSSEMSHNMSQMTAKNGGGPEEDKQLSALERRLGGIAEKIENEKGELDLHKLTGPEAMQFMASMGIPIGGRI